jgi:hypothetical protein
VLSLLFPRLRQAGIDTRPRPMTPVRQGLLIATLVVIIGYPITRFTLSAVFSHLADGTAAAIIADPALLDALRRQNAALATQSSEDLDRLDSRWIEERKNPAAPLNAAMLADPASVALQAHISGAWGAVSHAIVMDARGRNVAIGAPTTDYWQGDEPKYLQTVRARRDTPHRGAREMRHDGAGEACWISRAIVDQGEPIGAIALEYNLTLTGDGVCGR